MSHPHEAPFVYDTSLLASCANSPLAQSILLYQDEWEYDEPLHNDSRQNNLGSTRDCLTLLEQYSSFYNRPFDLGKHTVQEDISKRHAAFLQSVIFVHRHNNDQTTNHEVALNRFSDVPLDELSDLSNHNVEHTGSTRHPLIFNSNDPITIHLKNDEVIMEIGSKIHYRQKNEVGFRSRQLSSGYSSSSSIHKQSKKGKRGGKVGHSYLLDKQNELDGLKNRNDNKLDAGGDDPYKTHLNWATEDNPDGVAIVHPPLDQGVCGSCWAVSALGTMESSIARNMASIGYKTSYDDAVKYSTSSHVGGEIMNKSDSTSTQSDPHLVNSHARAVLAAQQIERKSIEMADLSVQELLDCDTRYDQGCTGGNPLLAFYFLHKYGVTSAKNYPYVGKENACNLHKVGHPIATVETWGVLTEDHEDNMERVLRYIGPISVTLRAYDQAFLSYSGGIFMSTEDSQCNDLVADHAMIIVGYGEEVSRNGTKLKYWIARNSWGTGWGEEGYVKMARVGGKKGERGTCGISRSPSVALGGMFTSHALRGFDDNDLKNSYFGKLHEEDDESVIVRASEQVKSIIHQIRVRLGLIKRGIMLSTLNGHDVTESKQIALLSIGVGFTIIGGLILFTLRRRSRCASRKQRRKLRRAKAEHSSHSPVDVCEGTAVPGEQTSLLQSSGSPIYMT